MYEKPNANGLQQPLSGLALLRDPALNRGTGFTEAERDKFNLRGLLPPRVHTQDEQAQRVDRLRGDRLGWARGCAGRGCRGSRAPARGGLGRLDVCLDAGSHVIHDPP